jgi:hypothetical protein
MALVQWWVGELEAHLASHHRSCSSTVLESRFKPRRRVYMRATDGNGSANLDKHCFDRTLSCCVRLMVVLCVLGQIGLCACSPGTGDPADETATDTSSRPGGDGAARGSDEPGQSEATNAGDSWRATCPLDGRSGDFCDGPSPWAATLHCHRRTTAGLDGRRRCPAPN